MMSTKGHLIQSMAKRTLRHARKRDFDKPTCGGIFAFNGTESNTKACIDLFADAKWRIQNRIANVRLRNQNRVRDVTVGICSTEIYTLSLIEKTMTVITEK